jgi:holliday junction DNA helicase RuvA
MSHAFDCKHFAPLRKLTQSQSAASLCKNCAQEELPVEEQGKVSAYSAIAIFGIQISGELGLFHRAWRDHSMPVFTAVQSFRMIAHLRGTLLAKRPNQAIVETHGVGYDVAISVPTFTEMPAAGAEVALHVHTHVREDALSLYGFLRLAEKQLFEKLLTVSGIGPKLAITILSGMPVDEMVGAIRGGDLARLTRIPGIGKKTAERMVLELRDKLTAAVGASEVSATLSSPVEEDVVSALVNLGYQRAAADKALIAARGGNAPQSFEILFREALRSLSK